MEAEVSGTAAGQTVKVTKVSIEKKFVGLSVEEYTFLEQTKCALGQQLKCGMCSQMINGDYFITASGETIRAECFGNPECFRCKRNLINKKCKEFSFEGVGKKKKISYLCIKCDTRKDFLEMPALDDDEPPEDEFPEQPPEPLPDDDEPLPEAETAKEVPALSVPMAETAKEVPASNSPDTEPPINQEKAKEFKFIGKLLEETVFINYTVFNKNTATKENRHGEKATVLAVHHQARRVVIRYEDDEETTVDIRVLKNLPLGEGLPPVQCVYAGPPKRVLIGMWECVDTGDRKKTFFVKQNTLGTSADCVVVPIDPAGAPVLITRSKTDGSLEMEMEGKWTLDVSRGKVTAERVEWRQANGFTQTWSRLDSLLRTATSEEQVHDPAASSKNTGGIGQPKPPEFEVKAVAARVPEANSKAKGEAAAVVEEAKKDITEFYTLDQLKDRDFCTQRDVDPTCRENYLSDAEFNATFSTNKEEFAKLPKWKRDNEKKKHGLF